MPREEIDKLNNIKKQKFVEFYVSPEVTGNVSVTCDAVGISRGTYYLWLEEDKLFRDIMKEAKMRLCDDMEQVLIGRAVDKSDTALIYWLKYNHPQYKEVPANFQIGEAKILVMPSQLISKYGIPSNTGDSSK